MQNDCWYFNCWFKIHERQKYQPQRITVPHTHMHTGTLWQHLAQRLIDHLFVYLYRTTRPTRRWGGAAERSQPICTTGKQETQQGVQQNRCSGSGWRQTMWIQAEDKRGNGRKACENVCGLFKRQQVNTNRSSTSLLWFCCHTQHPLCETNKVWFCNITLPVWKAKQKSAKKKTVITCWTLLNILQLLCLRWPKVH